MSRRKILWSELPPELLSTIAARFHCRSDILNFRSVCQSWRNSAPLALLAGKTTILSPILPHHFSINSHDDITKTGDSLIADYPLVLVATSVILIRSIVNPSLPPLLFYVEEFDPGKLHLREFFRRTFYPDLPTNFPDCLSLPCFRVSELSRFYTLKTMTQFMHQFNKVLFYVDSHKCENVSKITDDKGIDDCSLMVLCDVGSLSKITLKDGKLWGMSSQGLKTFDDFVCFKGRVCVIDRKGRLYWEKNGKLERPMVVSEPVGEGLGSDRKKRLVVEPCGELYLVYRCPRYMGVVFKVYKLNEGKKKWDELKGIGDDRILVATHDGCFFVPTRDIPQWGGNCLVFSKEVFPSYNNVSVADSEIFKASKRKTLEIAVFHFETGDCRPISDGYAEVLRPVPAWLSSDAHTSKWLNRGSQKDRELESSPVRNHSESSDIKETSCTPEFQGHTQAKECLSSTDDWENLYVKGSTSNNTRFDNAVTSIPKSLENGVSKTKFEGVDVSSDLVPTLKEIWAKHGNILEQHPARSNDLIAWALESIAKVVILVDNTSGRSLNNSQVDYLSSTLFDLQLMRLNVSWLVPSVAKVLNLHKAMASKAEIEGTLKEIDNVATQVEEMKSKFLAEVGGLERMLDEQRVKVLGSLNVLDCLDRGNSLGM